MNWLYNNLYIIWSVVVDIEIFFEELYWKIYSYKFNKKNGIKPSDLADYSDYITEKIAHDLRVFVKYNTGYPFSFSDIETWNDELNKIILLLESDFHEERNRWMEKFVSIRELIWY